MDQVFKGFKTVFWGLVLSFFTGFYLLLAGFAVSIFLSKPLNSIAILVLAFAGMGITALIIDFAVKPYRQIERTTFYKLSFLASIPIAVAMLITSH